ncbi:MAG: DNA topoisomerase I, partial [Candidatus Magasanikbacteria bacterium]|nr:DNA topoisomerase I [Candidatus Magasanikbacteria bacterium]
KGAQEAHEAIRPSDPRRTPESIAAYLDPQQLKLYALIWKRAVSTQMTEARLNKTNIDVSAKQYMFRASGQSMIFEGWLKLYPEAIKEEMLPVMKEDDTILCKELKPEQHFTEPPARYSDATLVKTLEEYGIGRPSTYAPTISTIEARGYIERDEQKRLKPLDIAGIVTDLLVEHFSNIADYGFTAQMEENLDEIAIGTKDWRPIISTFYHPFHENILKKTDELSKDETTSAREIGTDPVSGKSIYARIGRFGPFVQKGSKNDEEKPIFAKLPNGKSLDTVTLEDALHYLSLPRILGKDAEGNTMSANVGRFGPYVQVDKKFYSLKTDDPYTITKQRALEVIAEKNQADAQKIIKEFEVSSVKVLKGQYGPYITDTATKTNAKIPKDIEPQDLTLEQCQKELKENPSKKGRRKFRKKNT